MSKQGKSKRRGAKFGKEVRRPVSDVRERKVIAIACSDLHLSHKPPIARSAEPDWYEAMRRSLLRLWDLKIKYDEVPILYAGDIFHKWNPPPELINFAIRELPKGIAIPGQHDLAWHDSTSIQKTAYWTLCQSDVLASCNSPSGVLLDYSSANYACGFPWGVTFNGPESRPDDDGVQIALIHAFCWKKGFTYPDAPESGNVKQWSKIFRDFDIAIFGDNHQGFYHPTDFAEEGLKIFNCGTFMRRTAAEINYKPQVGLIYSDGTVEPHYLDCSEDKFIDIDAAMEIVGTGIDLADVVEELQSMGDKALNFTQAIRHFFRKNPSARGVVEAVFQAIEEKADL